MKKLLLLLSGLTLCVFMAHNSYAVDITPADATIGGTVSITVTTGPTFDDFSPSTNVVMDGVTVGTSFAATAYHYQVNQKKSGKQFGMAADSSAMYYQDISATAATATTGTNSAALVNYTKM